MTDPVAVVMTTHAQGAGAVDAEVRVQTLGDLYRACRDAPPSAVVRVLLKGDEGEVLLNFGSFMHGP
jgi:hypothetical protein